MQYIICNFAAPDKAGMKLFTEEDIRRAAHLLAASRNTVAICHINPDGDALGSCLGLTRYLSALGVVCNIIVPTPGPHTLDFIFRPGDCPLTAASQQPGEAAALIGNAGLIVCLDLPSIRRAEGLETAFRSARCPKMLIDHHQNPARDEFDLVFSAEKISSTCELLFHILQALPDSGINVKDIGDTGKGESFPEPGKDCLDALMTGMTTDTNNFANSTYPSTFGMASFCLSRGVDRDSIVSSIQQNYREARFRLMGYFLSEKMRISDRGVAYAVLSAGELERFGIREGETEGFVNIPLGIASVKMSIFLREDAGVFRVSIRSKKGVSASRLAAESFNGGGHEQAAGGRLPIGEEIPDAAAAERYIRRVTDTYFGE